MCGETLAEVTAWSTAVLTVVGVVTLVDLGLTRRQRRKAVDLQIGRRAFRVRSMMREWLNDPALKATDNLTFWVERVVEGEAEVERLLEEMVDLAVGASKDVRRLLKQPMPHLCVRPSSQINLDSIRTQADRRTRATKHWLQRLNWRGPSNTHQGQFLLF